jgi:beta-galactosidase
LPPPEIYDLNQGWLFGGSYKRGAEGPAYSEAAFAAVTLPHTVTPLAWGGWDPARWEQVFIYRRHIRWYGSSGTRVFLDFEGVMTSATVFLHGVQVAQHQGGYLPWSVELTHHLTTGDNVLAVTTDGRWQGVPPDGKHGGADTVDFLQPTGIYREAALRVVPEVFVADVYAQPTNVLSDSPSVGVQVTIDAGVVPKGPVTVTATLLDGSSQLSAVTRPVQLRAAGRAVVELTLEGFGPVTLWSPDQPKLYQVAVTIVASGVSHTLTVNTGFRTASFQLDGFYLNGERLQIFGLNRHQLFPYTGMAASPRLQRRDVELLKDELNCNMVRCSHYPQSPAFLDACDELGLMVWEEAPGWDYVGGTAFQQLVIQNVHDMVIRDRNRPSVIVWATRLDETHGHPSLYAQTRQMATSLDPSRQTTGAMSTQSTVGWAQDLFAYDDYHSAGGSATLLPPVPGVPYLVSEAVGALDGAPLYRWIDDDTTLATQALMHAHVHDIARSNPAYAGLLGWAGIDYASLDGGSRVWNTVKWPGVLDTFRVAKPGAAFYQSQVDPATRPVLVPVFFWDFSPNSPATGPGPSALIATNCDLLELFVDGLPFATGTPNWQDFPNLAHPPVTVDLTLQGTGAPELRIDGYVAGQRVASVLMSSDPTRDQLALTVDDQSIQGDGTDATRFTFRALDAYGNQRPYPAGDVTLSLTGPATLIADNPFPFEAYGGVGGGFVRSRPGTSGTVSLTATHETLGRRTVTLTVEPAPVIAPSFLAAEARAKSSRATRVSAAALRAALARVLSARGRAARIQALLRHSSYTVRFDAPAAGRLVVSWYSLPAPGTRAATVGSALVAEANVHLRRRGIAHVRIRLTPSGRALLEHSRFVRLRAEARFTAVGGASARSSRVIDLSA